MSPIKGDRRGAALILEIIIYLVIVALIAVAVISGIKAMRDLVYSSHSKGDVKVVQAWAEGKFSQDGVYPNYYGASSSIPVNPSEVTLTEFGGIPNRAWITSVSGSNAGYCIRVGSDLLKGWFYVSSNEPSRIMQTDTATANGAAANGTRPPSGIPGLSCP